ncbi:MAG: regulatory protein RecX [Nocardioides sp.]
MTSESGYPDPEPGPDADPESVARRILLDQLTGRARSRHELALKLAARNVPEELGTTLLDRFTEVGLIDDLAFARMWVEQRQSSRGLARGALAQELRQRGISEDTVATALAEIDSEAEEVRARELVRKKLRSMSRLPPQVVERRLIGQLARKGYPVPLAARIVREELT